MDKVIDSIGRRKLECYYEADEREEDAYEVNCRLERMRGFLENLLFTVGKNPAKCKIYFYKDDRINAFSYKLDRENYIIALSTQLIIGEETELVEYFYNSDLKKYFWSGKKPSKYYAKKVHSYMLMFIVLHEYYHILNGHKDIAYAKNVKMKPNELNEEQEKNRISQIMECNADFCAIRLCVYTIFEKNNLEDRDIELRYLGFALYYTFLIFQADAYEEFDNLVDLFSRDHPPASIRFVYALCVMTLYIGVEMDEKYKEVLRQIADMGIYFDRIYYMSNKLSESLSALGYSKKGMKHLNILHEGWNELREKLDSVAYIYLRKNEPIDFTELAWVDRFGDFKIDKLLDLMR